jgi:hypothetical protein
VNREHVRYFFIALVSTFIASIAVGGLIVSLAASAAGAAYIGGWWTNLAVAGTVAILGGRKVARIYTEPRQGKVAGTAIGFWVGIGAALGQLGYSFFVINVYHADVRAGLAFIFMLVSFIISSITGAIAGRETAHPPEEEEA